MKVVLKNSSLVFASIVINTYTNISEVFSKVGYLSTGGGFSPTAGWKASRFIPIDKIEELSLVLPNSLGTGFVSIELYGSNLIPGSTYTYQWIPGTGTDTTKVKYGSNMTAQEFLDTYLSDANSKYVVFCTTDGGLNSSSVRLSLKGITYEECPNDYNT